VWLQSSGDAVHGIKDTHRHEAVVHAGGQGSQMRGQTVVYDFSKEVELPHSQVGVDHPQKQRGVLIVVCLDKRDLIFVPEQFRFSL